MSQTALEMANTLKCMERIYSHKFGLASKATLASVLKHLDVPAVGCNYTVGNVIPMYLSSVSDADGYDGGSASSLNLAKSRIKTFGEFMERYCANYTEGEWGGKTYFDSHSNLSAKGVACLDFADLITFADNLYNDPQFPYAKYSADSLISWIEGEDLIRKGKTMLPAQKVFLGFPYPKDELIYTHAMSTGLACGSSYAHAALSAIYEVIERDSFMLTWLFKMPGIRIEIDSIRDSYLWELYNHIRKYLIGEDCLFIYDISRTKGVWTILTFIRNDMPDAYGLIVSSASHTNPELALIKALEELCQSQSFAYQNLFKECGKQYQCLEKTELDTLHKHFFYYSTGRHGKNIDFISSSDRSTRLSKMVNYSRKTYDDELEYLTLLFRDNCQSLYIADVTKPEICSSGFFVLKAIISEYVDLVPSHKFKNQKNSRLQDFREKFGAELNDDPHPFP